MVYNLLLLLLILMFKLSQIGQWEVLVLCPFDMSPWFDFSHLIFLIMAKYMTHRIYCFNHFKSVPFSGIKHITILCNNHYCLFPEKFHHPQMETLYPFSISSSFPHPSSLWQPKICFLSQWIWLFWIFHINGTI